MALIDDFKIRFPEFDSVAVDTAWPGLEASWPCMYGGQYGATDCEDEKILNLIAHLFVVGQKSNSSPALLSSSKSVGSVSTTKQVDQAMSNRDSFFSSSKYGQQFLFMIQFRQGAVFV